MEDAKPERKPRLTSMEWGRLKNIYVNGSETLTGLAQKEGINPAGVMQRALREQWGAERSRVADALTATAAATLTAAKIDELSEFNAVDLKIAKAFRQQIAQHISAAQQKSKQLTPNDIRALTSAAEAAQRIGRLALGASTENKAVSGDISISDPLERLTSRLAVLAANEGTNEVAE